MSIDEEVECFSEKHSSIVNFLRQQMCPFISNSGVFMVFKLYILSPDIRTAIIVAGVEKGVGQTLPIISSRRLEMTDYV